MLIRSQDKKRITTDLNLEIFVNEDRNEYVIGNITRGGLGTYSTEEKAIKVLNMICSACDVIEYAKFRGSSKESFCSPIFEMPQDEEVKA